ncbi:MAG: protein-L-isoaspartate(D-aspartate) O-methyltransferase [Carboxylicivirga sp.]|nr:protein-L-isoaspartate(D-aspartate) O-methyltransferase [Carboxylicivirga sp.]
MFVYLLKILLLLTLQNTDSMRTEMVNTQLINRGIKCELTLKAMSQVERHQFVPYNLQSFAYDDRPLPIGFNQTISQPYIVAYMTEQLQLKKDDKVLEIGTGSGYQAAVLAEIAKNVYTIEIVKPLGLQADSVLKMLDYENIHCKIGDGYHGWLKHAPYDAIIITASPEEVPNALFEQLAEGGRMIVPVELTHQQYLMLYTKKNNKIRSKKLLAVRFVPFTRSKK